MLQIPLILKFCATYNILFHICCHQPHSFNFLVRALVTLWLISEPKKFIRAAWPRSNGAGKRTDPNLNRDTTVRIFAVFCWCGTQPIGSTRTWQIYFQRLCFFFYQLGPVSKWYTEWNQLHSAENWPIETIRCGPFIRKHHVIYRHDTISRT